MSKNRTVEKKNRKTKQINNKNSPYRTFTIKFTYNNKFGYKAIKKVRAVLYNYDLLLHDSLNVRIK